MASLGGFINVDWSINFTDNVGNYVSGVPVTTLTPTPTTFDYVHQELISNTQGYTSLAPLETNVEINSKTSTSYSSQASLNNITIYDNSGNPVFFLDSSGTKWILTVTLANQTDISGTIFNVGPTGNIFTYNESTTTWYGKDAATGTKTLYDIYLLSNNTKGEYIKVYDYEKNNKTPLTTSTSSGSNAYPIEINEVVVSVVESTVPPPGSKKNICLDGFTAQSLYYNGYMLPLSGLDSSSGYVISTPTSSLANNTQYATLISTVGTLDIPITKVLLPANLSDPRNIFTNSSTTVPYGGSYTYYNWFSQNCASNSTAAKLIPVLPLQNPSIPTSDVAFITAGFITLTSSIPQ